MMVAVRVVRALEKAICRVLCKERVWVGLLLWLGKEATEHGAAVAGGMPPGTVKVARAAVVMGVDPRGAEVEVGAVDGGKVARVGERHAWPGSGVAKTCTVVQIVNVMTLY